MDYDAAGHFSQRLQPGEILLWAGRPQPRLLSRADAFWVPAGIFWCGFGVTMALCLGALALPVLIAGIAFVLAGLATLTVRFAVKKNKAKKMRYGLSNLRVMQLELGRNQEGRAFKSAGIGQVPRERLIGRKDGTGSILFAQLPAAYTFLLNSGVDALLNPALRDFVAFYDIEGCEDVYTTYLNAKGRLAQQRGWR